MYDLNEALNRYVSIFENLTSEEVPALGRIMADTIEFKDPFSHVQTLSEVLEIFEHAFNKVPGMRFNVSGSGVFSDLPNTTFLTWSMVDVNNMSDKGLNIQGTSLVTFNSNGMVSRHIDHWDAASQFYERLPVLGSVLRFIKTRI